MPSVTITSVAQTGADFLYLVELKDDQQNIIKSETTFGWSGDSLDAAFDMGATFMVEAMEAKTTLVLGGLHG